MIDTSKYTKNQRSLLLFLESSAVEVGGLLVGARMNAEDHAIATQWAEEGFIQYGELASINHDEDHVKTHWVVLGGEAWAVAHQLRCERAGRLTSAIKRERLGYTADLQKQTA